MDRDENLEAKIRERMLLAMMAARYYQRLRDRYSQSERNLSFWIMTVGVATAVVAGLSAGIDFMRWVLVLLGGTSAFLAAFHRQRAYGIEATEAARYSNHFDDRALDWTAACARYQSEPASFSWGRFEQELQRDGRLPFTRFSRDKEFENVAYAEVHAEMGLDLPTKAVPAADT